MTPGTLAARRDLLALVLDALVPAGGGFPGGGAAALDHVLAVAAASVEVDRLLSQGLLTIEEASRVHHAASFASLGVEDRESVLRGVEQAHAGIFDALVRHTYDGYYTHPTVLARLGLEAGPLHPRGHRPEVADLPDLARVTARGPIYRQA